MDTALIPQAQKPRGLRALYAWMLEKSQGRNAWAALACFAFAEASFFPIPPDVMLLPMMLADRRRAFRLAAWCAFWSVMGGMLGYAIGALFWNTVGLWLIGVLHIPLAKVEAYRQSFSTHAYMIAVQGITPIPYKLVTIASGLAGVPFAAFMVFSTLVRTFRFVVLEGTLVHFFGAQAKELLEKYLEATLIIFLLLVVLGVVAVAYL
jgi:membrane protein YqaA with SNARE-associated domain